MLSIFNNFDLKKVTLVSREKILRPFINNAVFAQTKIAEWDSYKRYIVSAHYKYQLRRKHALKITNRAN